MKDRETRQKNRREKRTDEKLTLNTKLVLVIAGSLLLAVGLFFVWLKTTVYIIDKKYLDETATARQVEIQMVVTCGKQSGNTGKRI